MELALGKTDVLKHAGPNLKDNHDFVLQAVQFNGLELKHASERLKQDSTVRKAADERIIAEEYKKNPYIQAYPRSLSEHEWMPARSVSTAHIPGVKHASTAHMPGVIPENMAHMPGVIPENMAHMPGLKPGYMAHMPGIRSASTAQNKPDTARMIRERNNMDVTMAASLLFF